MKTLLSILALLTLSVPSVSATEFELVGDIDPITIVEVEGMNTQISQIKGVFSLRETETGENIPIKLVKEVIPLPSMCYNSYMNCDGAGHYYVISLLNPNEEHKKQTIKCDLSATTVPIVDPFISGVSIEDQQQIEIRLKSTDKKNFYYACH